MSGQQIDFDRINQAALASLESLLSRWLPGGKVNGGEYVAGSLDGEAGRSLSVNLTSGVWRDFAGDSGGSDPVSLFAAVRNLKMGEAARLLAQELGVDPGGNGAGPARAKVTSTPVGGLLGKKTDPWRVTPEVPAHAPPPPDTFSRKAGDRWVTCPLAARWTYRDREGAVLFHVCRFQNPDGGKEVVPQTFCYTLDEKEAWRWKAYPEPRPLYGLDRLAQAKPAAPILLAEGEKTADAASRLFLDMVAMTWPGGSKAVKKANFKPLKGRRVSIWPDADKPGFEAALALAAKSKEVGAVELSIIAPPADSPEGWDLADAEAEGWTPEQVAEHLKANSLDVAAFETLARERYGIEAKDSAKRGGSTASGWFPFRVKADGVHFLEDDGEPSWLCSPLSVLAMTRDGEGREWGRLLEVEDSDGTRHRWAMPMSALAGDGQEYRRELLSMGLRLASGKGPRRLHDFLTLSRPEARARCVSRVGWHGRRFVLPDCVHGPQDGEEVLLQGGPADHAFRVAGSLQDWRESVGRYCVGNSRLVLAVSAALAAPLLALAGAESGGFHLVGGSSCGKTTALRVAGSVCGGGGLSGYLRQWRATDNALESVSSGSCDCLLTLDELGQADAKTAGAVAYMLTNGQGKARARRDGTARKPQEWRILFISSGEITLADKVREDGRGRAMAGQQVRVVDLQADAGAGLGLFENIHGFENGNAFSRHLGEVSARVYGSPLRAFLEKLTAKYDEAAQTAATDVRAFVEQVCPADADGQVKRVAGRFGLVAAAGELGVTFGVLPWPKGEARNAAARCFRDWLVARGGTGAAEVTAGLAQVRAFLEAHGSSRFEDLDGGENQRIINRAGYRQKVDGQTRYCIFPEAFKREVCAGLNEKTVCTALVKCGALVPDGGRNTRVVRTPDGLKRFYVITPAVFVGNTVSSGNNGNGGNNGVDAGDNLLPNGGNSLVTAVTETVDGEACYHCYRDGNEGGNSDNPHECSVVTALPVLPLKSDREEKRQLVLMWDGPDEVEI